jgi:hypothetical protein
MYILKYTTALCLAIAVYHFHEKIRLLWADLFHPSGRSVRNDEASSRYSQLIYARA